MKKIIFLLCAMALTGCTTIQTKAGGSAYLEGIKEDKAYTIATRAASSAGFTIVNTDRQSGIITATRGANRLLTWSDPAINIIVSGEKRGCLITISSVVGGQIVDYGTTENSVRDFCASLNALHAGANCH